VIHVLAVSIVKSAVSDFTTVAAKKQNKRRSSKNEKSI
jgi:hypothetical protein